MAGVSPGAFDWIRIPCIHVRKVVKRSLTKLLPAFWRPPAYSTANSQSICSVSAIRAHINSSAKGHSTLVYFAQSECLPRDTTDRCESLGVLDPRSMTLNPARARTLSWASMYRLVNQVQAAPTLSRARVRVVLNDRLCLSRSRGFHPHAGPMLNDLHGNHGRPPGNVNDLLHDPCQRL